MISIIDSNRNSGTKFDVASEAMSIDAEQKEDCTTKMWAMVGNVRLRSMSRTCENLTCVFMKKDGNKEVQLCQVLNHCFNKDEYDAGIPFVVVNKLIRPSDD